ncbi:branched-chain amino acid transaminase [Phormidium sp. FACHB-592]|uniref:Branched-chain-amino-acid aminotransferase n=1 Tax=Stenomitos frigidus AS-A4 TaxID=2933935 RepID=A0ABV0KK48_9CYAN|nr:MULTISPECIES: branched-chain amino acid transaminase [Cyanophyceae]MBD2036013.1 branched-chain amino acid transaminase [Leptolyngbya sp. FACHB-321]MBD2076902.1 branched-chain amino acid transaminase [Phormidium sp. FACHB-592]
MDTFLPIAYLQEQFIPFTDAKISIATHALHYGTGAIGGMRGIPDPQNPNQILLFRLERHCQRLSQSARFIHYDLPSTTIKQVIVEFIQKNRPTRPFYIRPLVYTSGLGIAPRLHQVEKSLLVYGLAMDDYLPPAGVNCRISSWQRQADPSMPLRGKITAAYIASALAKTEAVESGFDEAIMLNTQGKVSEASGMNIFIVRNGQLITPGLDQDILEGITRDSVLTLAKDLGIPTIERPIDKSELYIADEVFLTGTAAKVAPVKRVENYELPTDRPVTERLRALLIAITEKRETQYQDWVDTIAFDS